jgi:inosine-uridine nucleoside N-ribohydrolase
MTLPRPMLIDVDTGIDDAIALALASRLDDHRLVAVTTVAGNVPVEVATANTQRVLSWMGVDVPIHRGMSEPLIRPLYTAREHHGRDGLGGWAIPAEPAQLSATSAPEAIVELAGRHRGELTFVFVGPLTNLAVALMLEPRITDWVHRLVIMGGAFFTPGNTTELAEFNIFADPEAASRIARSWANAIWVPLDATRQAGFTLAAWERLASAADPGAVLVREVTRRTLTELKRPQSHLHDPLAVAVAEQPGVVETRTGTVVVELGEAMRGRTRLAGAERSDSVAHVAVGVDQEGFSQLFSRLADR